MATKVLPGTNIPVNLIDFEVPLAESMIILLDAELNIGKKHWTFYAEKILKKEDLASWQTFKNSREFWVYWCASEGGTAENLIKWSREFARLDILQKLGYESI